MNKIAKFFYLSPKDLGIQKLAFDDIVEIMRPAKDVIDGPKDFADTIYEIFENNKTDIPGNHIPNNGINSEN